MFRMAGITARNPSGRCHPDAKHRAAEGSVAFLSPKPRTGHNFRIAGYPSRNGGTAFHGRPAMSGKRTGE
jgi:hypothetical protein